LAVGDVVADVDVIASTTVNFQPAAGVNVLISSFSTTTGTAGQALIKQTNGTASATITDLVDWAPDGKTRTLIVKFFIDNTTYMARVTSASVTVGYSGIQTK
jgi:hypothetical protein